MMRKGKTRKGSLILLAVLLTVWMMFSLGGSAAGNDDIIDTAEEMTDEADIILEDAGGAPEVTDTMPEAADDVSDGAELVLDDADEVQEALPDAMEIVLDEGQTIPEVDQTVPDTVQAEPQQTQAAPQQTQAAPQQTQDAPQQTQTAQPETQTEQKETKASEKETEAVTETEQAKKYSLAQVVILSRHNIRSPLSDKGSMIHEITPHEWFKWTSKTGELSLLGAMLETTMGQYFRLWLEDEGLFPENYLPKDGVVRFYANSLQRTQATAHYFSTGLLPVAVVPVECHQEYGEGDATFLPLINFMNDDYEQDVREEIAQRGGGEGLSGYRASLEDAMNLLMEVTDMNDSEAYASGEFGDFLKNENTLTLTEGEEPKTSGSIKMATSIADALVLQYYEEPDDLKASFGHELTEDDWKTIGSVLGVYEELLFTSPKLAVNLAHPMLKELYAEMNAQGRKFSFLCGHDSTISSCLAALGVEEYTLPGAIEPTTPIGIKLVFSRWENKKGESFYQVNLVYQSVAQLRSLQQLSLEVPPMIVPISFEGVETNEDGMIAEDDLLDLFEEKIDMFDELVEEYEAEETEEAA